MWIKSSGQLSENVYQLITPVTSHLLVYGEATAIVDTGVSAAYLALEEEIMRYLGKEASIDFILLTHAHFDHLGGIPFLRRFSPQVALIAAPLTAEILANKEMLETFYRKNLACAEAMNCEMNITLDEWLSSFEVTNILGDGDAVDLGADVEVKLIATPGHTNDSVSYFVKPDAALACAEAAGSFGGRDKVVSSFSADYADYLESLEKLASLDVRALSFPHSGVLTGEMVPKYLMEARQEAERFHNTVKERIEHGELIDEIFISLLPEWQTQGISPEGPFVAEQQEALLAMIKAAAATRSVAPHVDGE